jgi:hypothetical protein
MAVRYILWSFGICFQILVCCTKKSLATLAFSVKQTKAHYQTFRRYTLPLGLAFGKAAAWHGSGLSEDF